MRKRVRALRDHNQTIGCVPTMGSLHQGHASLIRAAADIHACVVVSVFVNPTQFSPSEDFRTYPRNLAGDAQIVWQAGGTLIFAPSVEEMYPNGPHSSVHINGITEVLEGASRPTHFDGVATVVSRLFDAIQPDEAFFGQKDLQQTLVIRRLVETSQADSVKNVQITVLPTLREPGGLAMSSRNVYLSDSDRSNALVISRALSAAAKAISNGERSYLALEELMKSELQKAPLIEVDYAVAVNSETLRQQSEFASSNIIALLIAARVGSTRLIDNELVVVP